MQGIGAYDRNRWRGRRVGLLGGSFNPAHEGHRYVSLMAMQRLGLDAVWWLVSPQNPLKPTAGMAPQAERLASAARVASHPRIIATDIEKDLGTRYTRDTLRALKKRFPETSFVWLMGSDNLRQFHRWKNWAGIFAEVPVCVLSRPPLGDNLRSSPALERFRHRRLPEAAAATLPGAPLPAWVMLNIPRHHQSSTALRREGKWR